MRRVIRAALVGLLAAVLIFAISIVVISAAAFWPRIVHVDEHEAPDFTLYVTETRFMGTAYTVERGGRGVGSRLPWTREQVGTVLAGSFETRPIDRRSVRFEWHEDRRLVALRGSELLREPAADRYLMLLRWDDDGVLTEVPIEVSEEGAVGDHWGRIIRERRHEAIQTILSGDGYSPAH